MFQIIINSPKWIKEGYPSYRQVAYNTTYSIESPLSTDYEFYKELVDSAINGRAKSPE